MKSLQTESWKSRCACAAIGISIALLLGINGLGYMLDLQITNHLFKTIGTRFSPSSEVVLVVIDDASLQVLEPKIGRWPWPRSYVADLINSCKDSSAIGIDILFLERDLRNSEADQLLARAMKQHGRVALAGTFVSDMLRDPAGRDSQALRHSLIPLTLKNDAKVQNLLSQFLLPIPLFAESASRVGHANYFPSADNLLRSYPYFVMTEQGLMPSLVGAVMLNSQKYAHLQEWLTNERKLKRASETRELLFYHEPFQKYSALDIFSKNSKRLAPHWADGKIVLIGMEAEGLRDLRATPITGSMSGLNIHATALSNFLQQTWLRAMPSWSATLFACFCGFLPIFFWHSSLPRALIQWGFILLGYLTLGGILFYWMALRVPWSQPMAAFLTTATGLLILWVTQERALRRKVEELQRMKQMLGNMLIHDLKSPLSAMLMLVESVLPQKDLSPKTKNRLERAQSEGENLSLLLQSLLDIQRLEHDRMQLSHSKFLWKDLIDDTLAHLNTRAQRLELKFEVDVQNEPLFIMGDRDLLHRVLVNLIENALDFARPNTAIRCESFLDSKTKPFVVTRVINQGPSLEKEAHEKIFEIFSQSRQEGRRSNSRGSGLGLAFCKLAVVAHGGSIQCMSPLPGSSDGFLIEFRLPQNLLHENAQQEEVNRP
jgi:signal transduction histidine kinase